MWWYKNSSFSGNILATYEGKEILSQNIMSNELYVIKLGRNRR